MHRLITTVVTLLPAILATSATNTTCPKQADAPTLPQQIPIFDVPSTFANAADSQPADTVAQILNTLSLYPLSIDGKDFNSLSRVFTEDAIANFSAPVGVLTPLTAIKAGIEKQIATVDTQHAYGTQIVEVLDACSARSVSYFTASHFGRGSYLGEVSVLQALICLWLWDF